MQVLTLLSATAEIWPRQTMSGAEAATAALER
jgi:hypothetical protein